MLVAHPEDIAQGFVEAWNDHDGDAIACLFSTDADFVNVVGFHWRNADRIARAHRRGFDVMFGASKMRALRVESKPVGTDAAVVHMRWAMTGQVAPDGTPVSDREGIFTFVAEHRVQEFAEGWICVAAQNTDVVPGAETNVRRGQTFSGASYLPGQEA